MASQIVFRFQCLLKRYRLGVLREYKAGKCLARVDLNRRFQPTPDEFGQSIPQRQTPDTGERARSLMDIFRKMSIKLRALSPVSGVCLWGMLWPNSSGVG